MDSNPVGVFGNLLGLAVVVVIGWAVWRDANSRGMNGVLWGVLSAAFCIIVVPIYLIVRKPVLSAEQQRAEAAPISFHADRQPSAPGAARFCSTCGAALVDGAKFCGKCGASVVV
jgi:hypothetical protein